MTILLALTVLIGLAGNFGAKGSGLCSAIISRHHFKEPVWIKAKRTTSPTGHMWTYVELRIASRAGRPVETRPGSQPGWELRLPASEYHTGSIALDAPMRGSLIWAGNASGDGCNCRDLHEGRQVVQGMSEGESGGCGKRCRVHPGKISRENQPPKSGDSVS